jgi:hypothetical protein
MDEDSELIEVDAAELKALLAQVDEATREAAMFVIGLANAPPLRVIVPSPSKEIH